MKRNTKEDIAEILMTLYKIPGQWFIGGLIFWHLWKTMGEWELSWMVFLISIFCFSMEIVSPILAGKRLYEKFRSWLR